MVDTATVMSSGFAYTAAHERALAEDGYAFFDTFLSDDGLARCRERCDDLINRLADGISSEMMISTHHFERWVWDIVCEPAILDMVERQIGPNIVIWSTHLFCREPGTGETVPWHQDAPYWNVKGNHAAGVWIALDDITPENGPMGVLPSWHTKGVLPLVKDNTAKLFTDEISPDALPADADAQRVPYHIKAGQAAIHDVMLPHTSSPNRSSSRRRVLVLRYIAADGELGPKTYTNCVTGEPMPRDFFLVRGEDVAHRNLSRSPFE